MKNEKVKGNYQQFFTSSLGSSISIIAYFTPSRPDPESLIPQIIEFW